MNKLEKLNSILMAEANEILHKYGLLHLLNKYGTPIVTGSYSLELMTWRDLDINLEIDKISEADFFELGKEILLTLKPESMHFRNEFIAKTAGLPIGLYWGIYTALRFPKVWKIDLWAMDSPQVTLQQKTLNDLKSKITNDTRPIILMIKNHFCKHPEYRRGFNSMDIYNAVIKKDIKSIKDFAGWLEKDKGISGDFTLQ